MSGKQSSSSSSSSSKGKKRKNAQLGYWLVDMPKEMAESFKFRRVGDTLVTRQPGEEIGRIQSNADHSMKLLWGENFEQRSSLVEKPGQQPNSMVVFEGAAAARAVGASEDARINHKLKGLVELTFQARREMDSNYKHRVKSTIELKANARKQGAKRVVPASGQDSLYEIAQTDMTATVKAQTQQIREKKVRREMRVRASDEKLAGMVMQAFARVTHLSSKQLQEITQQSSAWLKPTLKMYCDFHTSGDFKNKYSLKPEYKLASDVAMPDNVQDGRGHLAD